jgi:hypothetical protein
VSFQTDSEKIEDEIRRWQADNEQVLITIKRTNSFLVRYEQLIEQPEFTLSSVCAFLGLVADYYLNLATSFDLSVEANRRKFITACKSAVLLGATGSKPTGTAPILFQSGATEAWHTNKGTGGGFTENGALSTASSKP